MSTPLFPGDASPKKHSESESFQSNCAHGYVAALLSAVVLSTTAIFIRYLTRTFAMPSLVLAFWRDGFVTLTLLVVLGVRFPDRLRVGRRHLGYLLVYGLMLALFNALWTLSVAVNGASVATVLVYCSGGFTVLLGWWILKERLNVGKVAAVLITFAGCALVSGLLDLPAWQINMAGIMTGVLSGLWYAIYSLMGRSAAQRGLNPWTTLFYTFGFATLYLYAFNFVPGLLRADLHLPGAATRLADLWWLKNSVPGWGALLLLAAGPTVVGFGLYNVSLVHLPSGVANLIVTLEPAFTAILAFVLFSERLSGVQIGGSLLIMGGVLLLKAYETWQEKKGQAAMPVGSSG